MLIKLWLKTVFLEFVISYYLASNILVVKVTPRGGNYVNSRVLKYGL